MKSAKQSFIHGTLILLVAGIINRILGFVPRIALPRIIGAEGIGLYQLGYPLLIVLLTFITGGIPLAIAKLVAESISDNNEVRVRRILRTALSLVAALSIIFTLICLWAAPWVSTYLLKDERVILTLYAMSPILLIVGISSVYRGYFQGRHNMIPTAASQIAETIMRIIAMLILAYSLLPYGIEWAAAGSMAGVLVGEISGFFVLYLQYRQAIRREKIITRPKQDSYSPLKRLLRISIPVTGSRLVGSGSYFLESIMIIQSLAIAGVATSLATAQYGALQGMVMPILLLPGVLTYSLSVSLVPSLSDAAARGDMLTIHKRLHQSLRLALVTGAPFTVIMYLLAEPLCYYLYGDSSVGHMLRIMAPIAIFYYFQSPLQAALQALDHPGKALMNTFAGACLKLSLIVLLAAKLQMGIIGAVIAISINISLVTILHYFSISKVLKFHLHLIDFLRVGFCALLMGGFIWLANSDLWAASPFLKFSTSIVGGILIYLIAIYFCGLIDKHDIVRIPWLGNRLRHLKK